MLSCAIGREVSAEDESALRKSTGRHSRDLTRSGSTGTAPAAYDEVMRSIAWALALVACGASTPTVRLTPAPPKPASSATPTTLRKSIVIADVLGGFACVGWSPRRGIALCFTGSTAMTKPADVTATFVALDARANAPRDVPVAISDSRLEGATIPSATLKALRAATGDFVVFDDVHRLADGERIGLLTFTTRSAQTEPGEENIAPRYHDELLVRSPKDESTLDTADGAISDYTITAYRAGSATVLLRSYSIADEGQYEEDVAVFVCSESTCTS